MFASKFVFCKVAFLTAFQQRMAIISSALFGEIILGFTVAELENELVDSFSLKSGH